MSGHNRWSKIKHTKAASDAKKSKGWTKLLKEITVAAKSGGDPDGNPRLRTAIDKARAGNIPNDTIKRSVQKGTGELAAESYEELVYEVYGPGGTAVVVEILTDNRNRTAGEIRKLLEKNNGKLAASGSVLYNFHKRGHIVFEKAGVNEDALMEAALEAGADDVRSDGEVFLVVTEAGKMVDVRDALEKKGHKPAHAEVGMYPDSSVRLEGKDAEHMVKLVQQLEDHDDVQNVYANYDIDDALLEQLSA
ncbi:MAG TPA: YebC/PmpR family DNA-binding transcriptional regulator [Polyangia bacterium]|nr:YebC/PmpR family DNA-binding transcriptional regulator [Polyangia bacterium]